MAHGRKSGDGHRGGDAPTAPKISLSAPIKGDIRAGLVGTWAIAFVNAVFFVLLGKVLDDVIRGESITGSLLAALAVFVLGRTFLGWLVPAKGAAAAGVLEVDLRDKVFHKVMSLGAPVRSQEQTGRIVATGTQSVEQSATFYATFLGPIIGSMTTPIVTLVVIGVAIDVRTALTLAIIVPIIPLTVGAFEKAFRKVSSAYLTEASAVSAKFLDALQGLATLKLFNQGRAYGKTLAAAAEELRKSIMRLLAGNQIILFVVDTVFSLGMVTAVTAMAMIRLRDGAITPGEAVALVLLGLLLIEPLDKVGQFFYVGMGGIAAGRQIREQLAQEATVRDAVPAGTAPAVPGDGSVVFENVSFAYDPDVPVLRGVSFAVGAGQKLAVIGASGSGKTTVANLIMRFLDLQSLDAGGGTIRVGGGDVRAVSSDWVRSQIALVAQTTFLFTGTLRENLLIARPAATDAQLREALSNADLDTFVAALPLGLDTPVGERGLSVSGGQAQRIAIARAFLKDAPILVLDEPTSNIDLTSETAIMAAIERLSVGRTVVMIAHRLSTVRNVDRIVVLDAGTVVESGSHDELMAHNGLYKKLFEDQNEFLLKTGLVPGPAPADGAEAGNGATTTPTPAPAGRGPT
jgi:ATP-binding cassette subfamily C protein CydD